jgi:hypothetical protein
MAKIKATNEISSSEFSGIRNPELLPAAFLTPSRFADDSPHSRRIFLVLILRFPALMAPLDRIQC